MFFGSYRQQVFLLAIARNPSAWRDVGDEAGQTSMLASSFSPI
jgi:hypothetical protein